MTKNEMLEYWLLPENQCKFYIELDKVLRETDKRIEKGHTDIQRSNFEYFNQYKGIFADDPIGQLQYWVLNACADTIDGYDSSMWSEIESKIKECGYDFFAPLPNLVKQTAKALGLTYRQLGEAIGYSEGALKAAASTDNISDSMLKTLELYNENLALKKEIEKINQLKNLLKDLTK